MQKVKKFDRTQSLCEIYSTGFQFALLSADFEQSHAWVLCKDFMTDVIWATVNKKSASIYGFTYDSATYAPIDRDTVRLIVRDKTKAATEFDASIEKSCEFLNLLESKMGFDLGQVEKVEHDDGGSVWMFTLDKRWIHASPVFSMLTLFIRVGCCYEGEGKLDDAIRKFKTVSHNDANYLKRSRKLRHLIIKKGLDIFKPNMEDNYPADATIDEVHNYWGIVNSTDSYSKVKSLWDLDGLDTIVKKKATKKVAKKATKKTATKKVASKKKTTKKAGV